MKIERVRKGTEVVSKINGKAYRVTDVSYDADGKVDAAVAAEMLFDEKANDYTLSEAVIGIAAANALAFRITKDAKPDAVVTGFRAENGKLLKNGTAVETGQLRFEAVLSEHIGAILLAAKTDIAINLVVYDPDRDWFKTVGSCDAIPELLWQSDDKESAMFALSSTQEIECEKEDGSKEKKNVFDETKLFFYNNGTKRLITYKTGNHLAFKQALYTESPEGTDVWFPYDEIGSRGEEPAALEKRSWERFALYDDMDERGSIEMPGQLHAVWSYAYRSYTVHNDDELLVASEDIEIESPLIAQIGDKTLIDVTRKDDTYRLTFSDAEYHFTTLVSKKTRDRGLIVAIE